MKCIKCGADIKPRATFCVACGANQNKKENDALQNVQKNNGNRSYESETKERSSSNGFVVVLVALLIIAVAAASVFATMYFIGKNSDQKENSNSVKNEIAHDLEPDNENKAGLEDDVNKEVYSDPETVVNYVRKRYYNLHNNLSELVFETDVYGVKRYYRNGEVVRMEIPNGVYCTEDFNYGRDYYFDNGELYFALATDSSGGEIRLYFNGGTLVRIIYKNGNILDNARDNYSFTKYEAVFYDDAMSHK